jgi:predicted HTH domain antitoxin
VAGQEAEVGWLAGWGMVMGMVESVGLGEGGVEGGKIEEKKWKRGMAIYVYQRLRFTI